jgi:hypothetical protein
MIAGCGKAFTGGEKAGASLKLAAAAWKTDEFMLANVALTVSAAEFPVVMPQANRKCSADEEESLLPTLVADAPLLKVIVVVSVPDLVRLSRHQPIMSSPDAVSANAPPAAVPSDNEPPLARVPRTSLSTGLLVAPPENSIRQAAIRLPGDAAVTVGAVSPAPQFGL